MPEAQGWINGQQIPFSQMQLPVWDLGVVAGASITEMARTFAHQPFRLADHLQRLLTSCEEIGFSVPWSEDELLAAANGIVVQNVSRLTKNADLGIVVFVTAGANRTYLGDAELPGPTVGIHTFPLPFVNWKSGVRDGVRLQIPERRQIGSESLPVHLKIRNRLHWWLADRDANNIEQGSRALLLDSNGFITETSTACFFAVINDEIVTPRSHVLNSMSRRMVKEGAAEAGIAFHEADLSVDDIHKMQSAFLSSTPVGVLPVKSIAGTEFSADIEGRLLRMLRDFWKSQTGVDPALQILNDPN